MVKNVLFLDDMTWRHQEFSRIADYITDLLVTPVYSAAAAIKALNGEIYDQVFLDHDLSPEDVMMEPDGSSSTATGMDVVQHILTMQRPPLQVIVHSCNAPAAARMASRLESHPAGIWVRRIAFPELLSRIHATLTQ